MGARRPRRERHGPSFRPRPAPHRSASAPTSPRLGRPGGTGPSATAERLVGPGPGRTPLALDGRYGPATQSAVVAYQRASSLPPDGVAGPGTWAALDRLR